MTKDEMDGWHHQLDGHKFQQAPRVGDVQVNLACCSPWGHKESDTTEQLKLMKNVMFLKYNLYLTIDTFIYYIYSFINITG